MEGPPPHCPKLLRVMPEGGLKDNINELFHGVEDHGQFACSCETGPIQFASETGLSQIRIVKWVRERIGSISMIEVCGEDIVIPAADQSD